jgi:hypothetical protein
MLRECACCANLPQRLVFAPTLRVWPRVQPVCTAAEQNPAQFAGSEQFIELGRRDIDHIQIWTAAK